MPDKNANADAEEPKTADESPSAEAMPFDKMIAHMIARCGGRPEHMGAMWAACCGAPSKKKENEKTS